MPSAQSSTIGGRWQLNGDFPAALRNLVNLVRMSGNDTDLLRAVEQAYSAAKHPDDQIELGFALAKAYDDLDRVDDAYAALKAANDRQRTLSGYRLAEDETLFANIRSAADRLPPVIPEPESASPRPVFVVGMPRSGTSLIEQILASHRDVHGAGELETMNRALLSEDGSVDPALITPAWLRSLGQAYRESLAALAGGRPVVIDKMPLNFRWIGFVAQALPDARFVHVRRDSRAVCWSLYRYYFPDAGLGFANSLDDLAGYYSLYDRLMAFWQERCPAERWYELDYAALTEHQDAETRRLVAFCGLPWDDACLSFHETRRTVRTQSALQVRRAMYRGSSDAWTRYAEHLQPLLAELQRRDLG